MFNIIGKTEERNADAESDNFGEYAGVHNRLSEEERQISELQTGTKGNEYEFAESCAKVRSRSRKGWQNRKNKVGEH